MKKTIMTATAVMLLSLSSQAQANPQEVMCSVFGMMGAEIISNKSQIPLSRQIEIVDKAFADTDNKIKTYAYGIVAIAYDTDLSASQYSKAVTMNCMKEEF